MSILQFPAKLHLISAAQAQYQPRPEAKPRAMAIDASTGLVTRQALLDRLEQIGQVAPHAPLSFLVVKISGRTPAQSEAALRPIAARVRELSRATDVVGRLTGTTFGIVLQGTGVTAAGAVTARLAHHLNRMSGLGQSVCITVSAATGTGLNADTLPVAAMESYAPCCG